MIKKNIYIFLSILVFASCTNIEKKNNKIVDSYEKKGFLGYLDELNIKDNNTNVLVEKEFPGNTIKITNLLNNKSETISNIQKKELDGARIIYVSQLIKNSLEINDSIPYIRIESSKLNPTFVANKAKIFQEEQKVSNTSKVSSVEVVPLSKNVNNTLKKSNKRIYLQYGSFYYDDYAKELNQNLKKFINSTKISIYGSKKKGYYVTIGPILNINKFDEIFSLLKNNDYEGYEILVK